MAGTAGEESGVGRSSEGSSGGQRYQSGELAEWRSSEQVENGTPSTSPPYWDTDDDDDGGMVFFPPYNCIVAFLCFWEPLSSLWFGEIEFSTTCNER